MLRIDSRHILSDESRPSQNSLCDETSVTDGCNAAAKRLRRLNISLTKLWKSVVEVEKKKAAAVAPPIYCHVKVNRSRLPKLVWSPFSQCSCVAARRCVIHHCRLLLAGQILHPWYCFHIKLFKHTLEKPASRFSLGSCASIHPSWRIDRLLCHSSTTLGWQLRGGDEQLIIGIKTLNGNACWEKSQWRIS